MGDPKQNIQMVIPTHIRGVSKRAEKFAAPFIEQHKSTSTEGVNSYRCDNSLCPQSQFSAKHTKTLVKKFSTRLLTSGCNLLINKFLSLTIKSFISASAGWAVITDRDHK